MNLGTLRTRLTIVGGALLMIVVSKAYYVEFRKPLDSLTDSEEPAVSRDLYENEKVQLSSTENIYYPYIPEFYDLKLSRDLLKTAALNREINKDSDIDALWIRKLLMNASKGTAFEGNRLLYKLQDSALHNTSNDCVIRIFQMCKEGCMKTAKKTHFEWTGSQCKFSNCRIETTIGKEWTAEIQKSDVVIFHIDDRDWKSFITTRMPGQLWVFHSKEAPIHGRRTTPPREFGNPFNISISYISEADIAPAYYYFDSSQTENKPKVRRKKKLMAWAASNCNCTSWNRTHFVQELQKYLDIDTYGKCGRLECPRADKNKCWGMLGQYKFYLALENSQCPEYITEKFWHNSLAADTVPIVYGAPKADYERLGPPHSFIHLDDFKTVKEFVDYIHLLDRNMDMYLEYFSWRRLGHVMKASPILTNKFQARGHTLCFTLKTLLLKSLYPEKYPWQERHPVFYDWWYGMCQEDTQKSRIMDIDVTMEIDVGDIDESGALVFPEVRNSEGSYFRNTQKKPFQGVQSLCWP